MPNHLSAGDVIRVYDGTIDPPNPKRFLCVCVADGWFLRINTKEFFKPHCPLPHAGNEGCLDHDSFLELRGVIEYDDYAIDGALEDPKNHLGSLCKETLEQVLEYLAKARTIPKDQRDKIIACLTDAL